MSLREPIGLFNSNKRANLNFKIIISEPQLIDYQMIVV